MVPLIFAAKECRSQSGFKKIEVSPKNLAAFCRNGERERGREQVRERGGLPSVCIWRDIVERAHKGER